MSRRLALVLCLVLLSSMGEILAADVILKVPAGSELKAGLQGATAAIRIGSLPRIVEFQFGWRDGAGRFRAYGKTQPMVYDREFLVRTRYDAAPQFARTTITLSWEGGKREVPMFRTSGNPLVFESTELSFPNLQGCRGLSVCEPQEDWGHENFPY